MSAAEEHLRDARAVLDHSLEGYRPAPLDAVNMLWSAVRELSRDTTPTDRLAAFADWARESEPEATSVVVDKHGTTWARDEHDTYPWRWRTTDRTVDSSRVTWANLVRHYGPLTPADPTPPASTGDGEVLFDLIHGSTSLGAVLSRRLSRAVIAAGWVKPGPGQVLVDHVEDTLNDHLRTLISDWQSNGNGAELGDPTAHIWHKCAGALLVALDES